MHAKSFLLYLIYCLYCATSELLTACLNLLRIQLKIGALNVASDLLWLKMIEELKDRETHKRPESLGTQLPGSMGNPRRLRQKQLGSIHKKSIKAWQGRRGREAATRSGLCS